MNNWKTVPLDEVCEICRGGSPRPIMDFITDRKDGVNWIKIGDVEENDKYITYTKEKIIPEGVKSSREVVSGDLILSNSMSFGRPYIIKLDGCIHDGWLRIRNNSEILDREYLYYFLCSSIAQNQFRSVATGSVVNNLKSDTVKAVQMKLPPLTVQVDIAKTMSSLDEEIEVIKKINHHLEQMAQAIYVELCSDGEVRKLSDILTVCYGKDHKRLANGNVPCYGSGGIMRYVDTALYNNESVLIPRKGSLNNVFYINEPFWTVDTMFYTQMIYPNMAKFAYFTLHNLDLAGMNVGSAVPSMTTAVLNELEIRLPSKIVLAQFEESVSPMFLQIQTNTKESACLATLRDTLLPRLMSGELSVSDIDKCNNL